MSLGGALLTFVSVFVAALLAFYLDGLRERRATERWVKEYLGFWRGMLQSAAAERADNDAVLTRVHDAVARWLTCAKSGQEPTWSDIDAVNYNNSISFTPLLLSAGSAWSRPSCSGSCSSPTPRVPPWAPTRTTPSGSSRPSSGRWCWAASFDLAPSQRTAVEQYLAEFERLRERSADWQAGIDEILEGLEAAGY